MRRRIVHVLAALVLLTGTGVVAAYYPTWKAPPTAAAPVSTAPVDPTLALDEIDVRTGDTFWGLHLDGVVPCSSMLVKGGGHLVMFSRNNNHEARCYFHVKEAKVVELEGLRFKLDVIGPDQVHVSRQTVEQVALAK